ncbi:Peptidyl-prolyl cis-trans isomerase E [Gracilariopsis chorda]|uniref:Peptidyl-prolyl cis-trans isomerase E n=1 Tax=Gracilariopsis chorda TaxID=448386 RepID=A0A2V3IWL4_9FLOR|nr:Peptidyl-prolyl cis-trans isomerase E [Gracilariopsis chorda]|eukprot:PXF46485.1 Peptidyl-prolyl cis-trans isomerase E [Gracilariopsis chorda]
MSTRSRHLYVHHLPPQTTEEALRNLFIPYGEISDLHIPLRVSGRENRGYAFVSFEEIDDADHARINLDKAQFSDTVIRVTWAAGRRSLAEHAVQHDQVQEEDMSAG